MAVIDSAGNCVSYVAVAVPHIISAELSWMGGVRTRTRIEPGSWKSIKPM